MSDIVTRCPHPNACPDCVSVAVARELGQQVAERERENDALDGIIEGLNTDLDAARATVDELRDTLGNAMMVLAAFNRAGNKFVSIERMRLTQHKLESEIHQDLMECTSLYSGIDARILLAPPPPQEGNA